MRDRTWTVEDHLVVKERGIVDLYERFVRIVEACGPFEYSVARTAITFKGTCRGFAGVAPQADRLDGYFDVQRRIEDSRIRRSSPYTKRLFVHHFRIRTPDELDEDFGAWIREAYAVGEGAHLR